MNALQLLDTQIETFSVHATKEEVMQSMEAKAMEYASIIKENKWLGYVSLTNLKASDEENLAFLIEEELSKTYFLPNQHLYEIYPFFQRSVLSEISIIDEEGTYLGSASKSILGEKLLNTLTYRGIGSIIVLKIFHTDFVLSRISNIVEENNAKIVGLMIEEIDQNYHINIKLNTIEIAAILSSFQRFSMEIESYHSISENEWQVKKAFEIAFKHFDL
jgi:hypothetical protein